MNSEDLANLEILSRFLESTFKGAAIGEILIDDLALSLNKAIQELQDNHNE